MAQVIGVPKEVYQFVALLKLRSMALGAAARDAEALGVIEQAEASARDADPMACDIAIAHGELMLAANPGDTSGAEAAFQRVVTLAESRGYKIAHVRALTHLASIHRGTQHERRTLDALAAVYDTCTEGFELPQLIAASHALESECRELAMAG